MRNRKQPCTRFSRQRKSPAGTIRAAFRKADGAASEITHSICRSCGSQCGSLPHPRSDKGTHGAQQEAFMQVGRPAELQATAHRAQADAWKARQTYGHANERVIHIFEKNGKMIEENGKMIGRNGKMIEETGEDIEGKVKGMGRKAQREPTSAKIQKTFQTCKAKFKKKGNDIFWGTNLSVFYFYQELQN